MLHVLSIYRFSLCTLLVFFFLACSERNPVDKPAEQAQTVSIDFPSKVKARYAEGFRISYHDDFKLLEILNPYQDKTDTLRYVLKPRGHKLGKVPPDAQVIETPVRSMIATSTTHIALTGMLDANDIVKGMVGAEYVYSRDIRKRLEKGKIVSFPRGEFNKEEALELDPELVMVSAGQSSQFDDYKVLMDSGINVLVNSEWLETTPLGKAEWVKIMAALIDREELARKRFNEVEERYLRLQKMAGSVSEKPLVINNLPYKGAWFVPGGASFTAQYLRDAGADYPWFDNSETGGLRKDFEVVYKVGLKADIWLNPGAAESKQEILQKDNRFRDFKSFRKGEIYNNNRRMSPSGGNDFWESGVVHPDRLLADLIHIFHPGILPGHSLYYYQKLDGNE